MSEPKSPTASVAKPREVSLAVVLCLAVGAAGLLQALTAFFERRHLEAGLLEVGKYMSVEQAIYRTTDLRGSLPLAIALGASALVVLVPLSVFLSRGRPWARMLTWIVGAGLIIGEVVLMAADSSAVKTGEFISDLDVPGGDPGTVAMLNGLLVPGWFPPLHYIAELLVLVGVIAVGIQLLRPASTEYFRGDADQRATARDDRIWSTDITRRS